MTSEGPPAAHRGPTTGAINEIVEVSREWAYKFLKPETWYKLNMSLGLKRLQELIQVRVLLLWCMISCEARISQC